jgi:hypothetical protein
MARSPCSIGPLTDDDGDLEASIKGDHRFRAELIRGLFKAVKSPRGAMLAAEETADCTSSVIAAVISPRASMGSSSLTLSVISRRPTVSLILTQRGELTPTAIGSKSSARAA